MEKLSRVKKYEALRKSIELDNAIDASSHIAKPQTKDVLKTFDTSVFKRAEISEDDKTAKRAKEEELQKEEEAKDTFTNEYLDDFIKEVREYNIRKGNRESENTEVDILYQLNAANRAKRTQYVEEISEDNTNVNEDLQPVLSKEEITQQMQKMLLEDEQLVLRAENDLQEAIDELVQTQSIELKDAVELVGIKNEHEVEKVEESVLKEEKSVVNYEISYDDLFINENIEVNKVKNSTDKIEEEIIENENDEDVLRKKLLAETQQLRIQLDEYEDELTGLSDDLEKNNKLLNFILCFLIVVLLIIIGFIAYSILKAGGI